MALVEEDFDLLHDVNPGKHFYQFYKSPEDLLKVLIPYWKAGIQKGDFCFWVAPSFLTVSEAKSTLGKVVSSLDFLVAKGCFEIISHATWYGDGEIFDGDLVFAKFMVKLEEVSRKGFRVMRVAGDASGHKPHLWSSVREYEVKSHAKITGSNFIALCSFPLHELKLQQTKDVLETHHSALIARV
ncbi:MAG: MEDS domain-containing protein [Candidatus Omnitrophica bacterium]|nr:MEDS domain-containing protein [Candidatus Omnitrophota bacterium]